jgi:hypothetical protein
MRTVTSTPSASILIESLRDIGYSFETALADVIDNSITAGASVVQIFAEIVADGARVGVVDNGSGMSEEELIEAMRPGSRSPLDDRPAQDLGRFGLGLKTASFSQCRRLTVASRKQNRLSAATWDLDHVAATDDWSLQLHDRPLDLPWTDELGSSGTVVVWEKLDRVVDQADLAKAAEQFADRLDAASRHLELVFHRFLTYEPGHSRIHLLLNNRELEPFDPFHANHPATQVEPPTPEVIRIGESHVTVQTYTLPHHSKVSPSVWEKYGSAGGYIQNQGFYIYRERRLIIWGTWFGLAKKAELTKLARVRVDMPNSLDAEWKIDVKKASAQPPHQVREHLRRIVERIIGTSKRVYTSRGARRVTDKRLPVWNKLQSKDTISYAVNLEHPLVDQFRSSLDVQHQRRFEEVLELVETTLPVDMIFADAGSSPEHLKTTSISEETLFHTLDATVQHLHALGMDRENIEQLTRYEEPFKSNWQRVTTLLDALTLTGALDGQ